MKPKKRIQEMTFAALLTAIAILIPSIMPIKWFFVNCSG